MTVNQRLFLPPLYAITDRAVSGIESVPEIAGRLVRLGVRCLQVREKAVPDRELLATVEGAREAVRASGASRPGTGCPRNLRETARVGPRTPSKGAILAPYPADAGVQAAVDALRDAGEVVIADLPGHESARAELGCDRRFVRRYAAL